MSAPIDIQSSTAPTAGLFRPHGRGADQPRRARLRHLLPPSQESHRVPRHANRRRRRKPDRGAAPVPGAGGPEREIQMYINSPGGQIDAGLAIYDTMHLIQPTVATTCIGMAASMGAVLLGGGAKGSARRYPIRAS